MTEDVRVPREPTPEQVTAGTLGGLLTRNMASAAYQAMVIAAAPAGGGDEQSKLHPIYSPENAARVLGITPAAQPEQLPECTHRGLCDCIAPRSVREGLAAYAAQCRRVDGLSDEQCNAIIDKLDGYGRDKSSYEYGLPIHHDDAMPAMREIIRAALTAALAPHASA